MRRRKGSRLSSGSVVLHPRSPLYSLSLCLTEDVPARAGMPATTGLEKGANIPYAVAVLVRSRCTSIGHGLVVGLTENSHLLVCWAICGVCLRGLRRPQASHETAVYTTSRRVHG